VAHADDAPPPRAGGVAVRQRASGESVRDTEGRAVAPGNGRARSAADECSVAEYLVDALADAGVHHIFGVIGGSVAPLFVATVGRRAQIVMAKHETGAAFMADGYARALGGLGACVATSGPGATNLLTGVAAAFADSVPLIVLTGQVPTKSFGKGAFQESSTEGIDIVEVFRHVTRYTTLAFRPDRVAEVWYKALRMALGGRPGPVHLSLPRDVQTELIPLPPPTLPTTFRGKTFDRAAIKETATLLLRAQRPAILAGHGVILAEAWDELRAIAEMLEIPVATTPKGKGAFPEDHRLSLGPFGYSGSPLAQWHLLESGVDVLLAVGTSLSEWGTLGWDRRLQPSSALIHVDIDPYEIGKNYRVTVPVIGDARASLTELAFEVRRQQPRAPHWAAGRRSLEPPPDRPRFVDLAAMDSTAVPIKPQRLMRDLQAALPPDSLVFVDGGANRSWAIHYWRAVRPRTFFCATGMASMGFGIAGPIGAKFAAPERVVLSIVGDGGFLMNGMEVSTAVHYGKQVIWVVLNDAGYGMAYHSMRQLNMPDVGTQYPRVDCARVAEGLGAQAFRIREPGEIDRGLIQRILDSGRPTVLDVEIDRNEVAPFGTRNTKMADDFGSLTTVGFPTVE
jgi:acetolactate synthase-1/2/3 large subunit